MSVNHTYRIGFLMIFIMGTIMVKGQSIAVDPGAWRVNLTNEITEAGNDFIGTYTSESDQMTIDISGYGGTDWEVSVRYEPRFTWDNSIIIKARRTGGTGIISGGTSYQVITQTDTYFFGGKSNKNNIPIQYELSNISVTLPAIVNSPYYRARITYTVTAL